jgi:hypothetical protein
MKRGMLEREEYVEQAYFFRVLRERLAENMAAQAVLDHVFEELLSTTRLPMAVQFLATELKHSGLLASGFAKLPHYFTPFQAFVIRQAEQEKLKFPMNTAMLILEREANYLAATPTRPGLFVYQFESIMRNRLGYTQGLEAMADDPFYDADWRSFVDFVRKQVGAVEFPDLVYWRSETYVSDQKRANPDWAPSNPVLFGEKEGKIARASRGRDPLYFFAALQRQLHYPEVPRAYVRDDLTLKLTAINNKLRELDQRMRLAEGELRGQVDLSQFGKPDILKDPTDD